MKRTLTLLGAALLAGLLLAAPAHATPVPSPSPSPSPTTTTPADPCALPTPSPDETIEELPQVAESPLPTLRRLPRLPLPRHCFATVKDLCEGESEVTLKNPIPNVIINYQVADEDFTRGVLPGHEVVVPVSSSLSPWKVFIVLDAEHKLLVLTHHYRTPKGCQTASPSPSVSPSVPVSESPEPQLPVTGRDLTVPIGIAGVAGLGLVACLVGLLRRRRSAV